jgi:hypothetical protein
VVRFRDAAAYPDRMVISRNGKESLVYHKLPIGGIAAGGGIMAAGMHSVGMIVAGATLLVLGVSALGLLPKLRRR